MEKQEQVPEERVYEKRAHKISIPWTVIGITTEALYAFLDMLDDLGKILRPRILKYTHLYGDFVLGVIAFSLLIYFLATAMTWICANCFGIVGVK